jgi:hypothetical protein
MAQLQNFLVQNNEGFSIPDDFAGKDSPKLKFNFGIEFTYRDNAAFPQHPGSNSGLTNRFAVKQVGRITPVVNYQDVNLYGFRTKVATKVDFSVLNLTMYDDSGGNSLSVLKKYMETISPIVSEENADMLPSSQTIGPLEDNKELGPIKHIDLYHFHRQGMTQYKFNNPRITNILADELDMTASDIASLTISFNYDSYHIDEW